MSNLVHFVLVGPNAGKTIGFSKDHTGKDRYVFNKGVMEMHPSRVTGRFVKFIKRTYSAVLESEVGKDGIDNIQVDETNSLGGEDVASELTKVQPSAAAGSAIHLKTDADSKPGPKSKLAKGS